MTSLHDTALARVEPERGVVWLFGERSSGSQICLPPSVPLEAEHYLWKDNATEREGDAPHNGSSSPLPPERAALSSKRAGRLAPATREYLQVIESLD